MDQSSAVRGRGCLLPLDDLLHDDIEAADELWRSVCKHGFVGCRNYGTMAGKFLDHVDFEPVLARAEVLDVPTYIHPNFASSQVMDAYYNESGSDWVSRILSGPGYGGHQEVGLQRLRMIWKRSPRARSSVTSY